MVTRPSARTGATGPVGDPEVGLAEVAHRLGVHYMTAYRYVRTGRLPAHQQGGQWQISEAAFAAFEAERSSEPRTGRRPRVEPGSVVPVPIPARRVEAFTDRLVAGDESGAWWLIEHSLTSGADLIQVHTSLFTPALRRIGDGWENGDLSVADEHRATVVASRLIGRLGNRFTRPGRTRGTVVLAGVPGDRHALPTALLADVLRGAGLDVVDLGADVPAQEIARVAAVEDRLLAVGVCATMTVPRSAEGRLRDALRLVGESADCPVLLGGSGIASQAMAVRVGADHWSSSAEEASAWFVHLSPRVRRPVEEAPR